MKKMIGDNISLLLETFQELTRRGDQAKLILETRNGEQFGTLTMKIHPSKIAEPGTRSRTSMRNSPSNVRRDQRRLREFLQRKSVQESHGSATAASTPVGKPGLASSSQENQAYTETSVNLETVENKPDSDMKSGGLDQKPNNEIERDQATNITDEPIMSQEYFEGSLSKWTEKINLELSKMNLALAPFNKNEETKDMNGEQYDDEKDDNIDAAKIWAKQQKQSLAK